MSVINKPIKPQAFEIVRDRIGRILADELNNQGQISYDKDLMRVKVWMERFLQFDKTEVPAINVMLAQGDYSGQTAIQHDGTYRYFIDCYFGAKAGTDGPGDVKAMFKLHKLLGVCRAIIMDPRYITLGFATPKGFIMNRHFESLNIQNPNEREHDADNNVMGRLTLSVKVPEASDPITFTNIKEFVTNVKLDETDKGYTWDRLQYMQPDYNFDFSVD